MSHAANIRNRQQHYQQQQQQQRNHRSTQTLVPAKRRKSSSPAESKKSNGVAPLLNGAFADGGPAALPTKDVKRRNYARTDESKVAVRQGGQDDDVDAVEQSSGDEEGEEDESSSSSSEADTSSHEDNSEGEEDDDNAAGTSSSGRGNTKDKLRQHDRGSQDGLAGSDERAASDGDRMSDDDAPTFGDLLRARAPEMVDVNASFAEDAADSKSLAAPAERRPISVPSATSLGTVLTQALRTNDTELLESCLQTRDLNSIRATIERLQSQFAATLLEKLAERLHKRPGRAGSLMVWVQWTIVAHGGYLAGRPAAMKQLNMLYQVVKQRATGLQPLLALKGKLDMLEAQMQLRRSMQAKSRGGRAHGEENDDEDVIYVEAEDDQRGSEAATPRSSSAAQESRAVFDEDEEDDMMPNGVEVDDDEDEEEENSSNDGSDLIDDEAEESLDGSEELSDDIDYDDMDEDEDVSDSEAEAVPLKADKISKRGRD